MNSIRALGCGTGLVVNPLTTFESILPLIERVDLLTLMTIDVGFAGQPFIDEMLAKIEQAITQAQLTGDIEAANALANLYKEIAAKGYENTQNIVAANQWGQQFGLSQAELTGTYNGTQTLAMRQYELQKQQVQQELEAGKIDMETARKQIEYINAQIAYMQAQTTGQNLSNKYSQWQLNQL